MFINRSEVHKLGLANWGAVNGDFTVPSIRTESLKVNLLVHFGGDPSFHTPASAPSTALQRLTDGPSKYQHL